MTIIFFLFSLTASADVRFEGFAWRADNSFEVRVQTPQPLVFRGTLVDAQRTELTSGPVSLTARSFQGVFVVLTFVESGSDNGQVIVLERQNSLFVPIQNTVITGRASTLANDVEGAVEGLKKVNNWDSAQSLRAMLAFFDANPAKKVADFYDAVELGHIKTVARPNAKGTAPPKLATPKRTPQRTSEWSTDVVPIEPRTEAPAPKRSRRSDGSWPDINERGGERRMERDYPGQRINPGYYPPRQERRRPRTLFDLLF